MKNKICKKLLAALLCAAVTSVMLPGCAQKQPAETPVKEEEISQEEPVDQNGGTEDLAKPTEVFVRKVTDAEGNQVEVPADLSEIAVTPIPWASVIYAIDGTAEHMTCVNPVALKAYEEGFLNTLAPDYAKLDTTCIGTDFSMNMEEMLNKGIQAAVIWDYQTDEAQQLTELGITPVMVKNETVEELQKSFMAIGQLLGKEDRAQQFIELYEETYTKIQSYQDTLGDVEKPKVLYLRNSELKLQGNDNFIKEALRLAGADNVAEESSNISMEEILEIDPDIILLSWFDSFTPGDLYNNTIDGQDWSNVKAVREKRVYKTPNGIYRWDAPGVETPLMMMWLAALIQPDVFLDIDMEQEVSDYFKTYFDVELTEENLRQILSQDLNSGSVQ